MSASVSVFFPPIVPPNQSLFRDALRFDRETRTVTGTRNARLSKTQASVVAALIDAPWTLDGRVLTWDAVRAAAWPDAQPGRVREATKVLLRSIRNKLDWAGIDPQIVETVRGFGIVLHPSVP